MRLLLAALLFALLPVAASAQGSAPPPDAAVLTAGEQQRYETLIHQLRCLVCQNETIADSQAPLAADLRNQVHAQIAAGRSDAEIKRYLTDRYGDFVLYKPPFKTKTWLLWGGPFLVLLAALVIALRFVRRQRPAAPTVVDTAALADLLDAETAGPEPTVRKGRA
jgi:cytochrome c-type biogenesis protein CcmH